MQEFAVKVPDNQVEFFTTLVKLKLYSHKERPKNQKRKYIKLNGLNELLYRLLDIKLFN